MNEFSTREEAAPVLPAALAPEPGDPRPDNDCPRCGKAMLDPGGIVWCPACGYCPLLEARATKGRQPTAAPSPSRLGAAEFLLAVDALPGWLRVLVVGVLFILVVSLAANIFLPHASYLRVGWSAAQLFAGLVALVVAHVGALRTVPTVEVRARSRSADSIVGLWRAAVAMMPATRWPVTLLAWGLTLVLCSVFVVGGFGWWLSTVKFIEDRPRAAARPK